MKINLPVYDTEQVKTNFSAKFTTLQKASKNQFNSTYMNLIASAYTDNEFIENLRNPFNVNLWLDSLTIAVYEIYRCKEEKESFCYTLINEFMLSICSNPILIKFGLESASFFEIYFDVIQQLMPVYYIVKSGNDTNNHEVKNSFNHPDWLSETIEMLAKRNQKNISVFIEVFVKKLFEFDLDLVNKILNYWFMEADRINKLVDQKRIANENISPVLFNQSSKWNFSIQEFALRVFDKLALNKGYNLLNEPEKKYISLIYKYFQQSERKFVVDGEFILKDVNKSFRSILNIE